METKNFAQLIREKRKSKGLSFVKLEEVAKGKGYNLSASYINRLETGSRKEPTVSTLKALIDALDLSLEEVLSSLNMANIFNESLTIKTPIRIPDDLSKLEFIVPMYEDDVILSDAQTSLLGKIFVNFYRLAAREQIDDAEKLTSNYLYELSKTIAIDQYLISLQDKYYTVVFDVQVLIQKYCYYKKEIEMELNQLELKTIHSRGDIIPLELFGEYWLVKRDNDILRIIGKVSEVAKNFNKHE